MRSHTWIICGHDSTINEMIHKYKIQSETLLKVLLHEETPKEEAEKIRACRSFITEFINDLRKML